jgi:hypothetical protein
MLTIPLLVARVALTSLINAVYVILKTKDALD